MDNINGSNQKSPPANPLDSMLPADARNSANAAMKALGRSQQRLYDKPWSRAVKQFDYEDVAPEEKVEPNEDEDIFYSFENSSIYDTLSTDGDHFYSLENSSIYDTLSTDGDHFYSLESSSIYDSRTIDGEEVADESGEGEESQAPSTGLWGRVATAVAGCKDAAFKTMANYGNGAVEVLSQGKNGAKAALGTVFNGENALRAARWMATPALSFALPENIAQKLKQLDPDDKLPGYCSDLVSELAPLLIDRLMANEGFVGTTVEWSSVAAMRENLEIFLPTVMKMTLYRALAALATSEPIGKGDLWDHISAALFKALEKQRGGAEKWYRELGEYQQLPDLSVAERDHKIKQRALLLNRLIPINEELLKLCGFTSMGDLPLPIGAKVTLELFSNCNGGKGAWPLMKEHIAEGIFHYCCNGKRPSGDNAPNVPSEAPNHNNKLVSLGDKLLRGAIEREITKAQSPLQFSPQEEEKLAIMDPKSSLKSLCDCAAAPIARKICAQIAEKGNGYLAADLLQSLEIFLNIYIAKVIHKALANLALSEYSSGKGSQDIWFNTLKGLLKYISDQYGDIKDSDRSKNTLASLQRAIREYEQLPESNEQEKGIKADAYRTISKKMVPLADALLKKCSLGSIDELELSPMVSNLIKGASSLTADADDRSWNLLRETMARGLFALMRTLPPLEFHSADSDHRLSDVSALLVDEGVSPLLQQLEDKSETIAIALKDLLEAKGWDHFSLGSLEKIIGGLFKGDDPTVAGFLKIAKLLLRPRIDNILNAMASAGAPKGVDAPSDKKLNPLTLAITKLLSVLHNSDIGKGEWVQRSIDKYRYHNELKWIFGAAKRHLAAAGIAMQMAYEEIQNAYSDGELSAAERNSKVDQLFIRHTYKILEAAHREKNCTELATIARHYRDATDDTSDDVDEIRRLLFGSFQEQYEGRFNSSSTATEMNRRCGDEQEQSSAILKEQFTPMAENILALTGLDSDQTSAIPGLAAVLDPHRGTFVQMLLLYGYSELNAPAQTLESYLMRLKTLFVGDQGISLEKLREVHDSLPKKDPLLNVEIEKREKAEQLIQFFADSCNALATEINGSVKEYIRDNSGEVVELINLALNRPLPASATALTKEAIAQLAMSDDSNVKSTFKTIEKLIGGGLLKLLVKISERSLGIASTESDKIKLMSSILIKIFALMEKHKGDIESKMAAYHSLPNGTPEQKEQRKLLLREIFKGVAAELIALAGPEPMSEITPPCCEKPLLKALRKKILPDLLGKIYCETTVAEREKAVHEKKLQDLFPNPNDPKRGSKVPQQAMEVFAELAVQKIPSYLALNDDKVANTILAGLIDHLGTHGGTAGARAATYLQSKSSSAEKLLAENLTDVAHKKDSLQGTAQSAKDFIHTALLKAMSNFSSNIGKVESGKGDFLQSMMLHIFQLVSRHVKQLEAIRLENNKTNIYQIDPVSVLEKLAHPTFHRKENHALQKTYLTAKKQLEIAKKMVLDLESSRARLLTKKITPGLREILNAKLRAALDKKITAIDSELATAQKLCDVAQEAFDNLRKEYCFAPIAEQMLAIADIHNADDLPFPSPLKEKMWKLLKEELLPSLFTSIYDSLLDKNILNGMLLSALDALNEATLEASREEVTADEENLSAEQKAFDAELGRCVLDIVKMLPQTMTKTILDIEVINRLASHIVGRKVRQSLADQSMLKWIHKGLYAGVESLIPNGKWVDIKGDLTIMQGNSDKLNFSQPMNAAEKRAAQLKQEQQNNAKAEVLRKKMATTLQIQIKAMIINSIKSAWNAFQKAFDRSIAKNCGGDRGWGMQVKRILDKIFRTLFIDLIGKMLYFIAYPLLKLIELIGNRYLESRADDIIKSWHAGMNDALLFDLAKVLIDGVTARKAAGAA